MSDFTAARRNMVDGQLRTNDVTDLQLLAAMREIPRERFTPATFAAVAYLDLDLPVGEETAVASRRLPKPMILAKLIQAAEIAETDKVLDVGCATGYSSAVISRLARSVIALEENTTLASRARDNLAAAKNVTVVTGELAKGCAKDGPYDVIILNGATELEPKSLCGQLTPAGRLLCVFGTGPGSKAMIFRHSGNDVTGRRIFDATLALLPGFAQKPAFTF